MSRVLLAVDNIGNRRLLAELLAPEYEVIQGDTAQDLQVDFDLCIMDGLALERLWRSARDRKRSEDVFLPFVLITSLPETGTMRPEFRSLVDEVVISPVEKSLLQTRLSVLIRTRSQAQELRRRKALGDAINELGLTITSTLAFDEIMRRVVVEAPRAIGCESCAIGVQEETSLEIRYIHGVPEWLLGLRFTACQTPVTMIALTSRTPVLVADTQTDPRVNHDLMCRLGIRSQLVIPLIARGQVLGLLYLHYHSEAKSFGDAQVDAATRLGALLSLALENARLYGIERRIADTLQEALLTLPAAVPGIAFGRFYHAATEASRVGGDFYDLFELEHDRIGILIGDVSGKGLPAASLTAVVRNSIRAYAYQEEAPAAIVAKTNKLVVRSEPEAAFVTVLFGILDKSTGRMVYCNAGHPSGIVRRWSGDLTLLNIVSPVIGAFEEMEFASGEVVFGRGDVLVLYTDGAIDARRDGEFFGEEGIIETVRSLETCDAERVPDLIFSRIMDFTDGRLTDDLAILTVSCRASH